MAEPEEQGMTPGEHAPTREYRTDEIVVHWESLYCIHSAHCLRGLPTVFDGNGRPWVHVDAASPDQIAETILRCPTGALHFERLDGGPQEEAGDAVEVQTTRNGPLYVRGKVKVLAEDGTVIREDTRVALCRCGNSQNKPFCDDSHTRMGWREKPRPPRKEGLPQVP